MDKESVGKMIIGEIIIGEKKSLLTCNEIAAIASSVAFAIRKCNDGSQDVGKEEDSFNSIHEKLQKLISG